ncbi:MAG: AbiH family protein [Bacilli bacterium]
MILYIIGNGFDINHGMKTSFKDFLKHIENKKSKSLGELENLSNEDMWNDFEKSLGDINYELFMAVMGSVYNRDENTINEDDNYYSDTFDFEHYLPNYYNLQKDLVEWISKVELPIKKYKLDKNAIFLTFNYTNVLELVYNINDESIIHIHGRLGGNKELQVGFGNVNINNILDEVDRVIYTGDFPYELVGYEMLVKYLKCFEKPITKNIEKYFTLFKEKLNITEIYILGFSFNQIDITYLSSIFENIDNEAKVFISYFDDKDKKNINKFIETSKTRKIIVDKMENILEKV